MVSCGGVGDGGGGGNGCGGGGVTAAAMVVTVMVVVVVMAVAVTVVVDFGICMLVLMLTLVLGLDLGSSVPICQRILLIAECELCKEIAGREDFIIGILGLSVVTESYVGHISMLSVRSQAVAVKMLTKLFLGCHLHRRLNNGLDTVWGQSRSLKCSF